MATNLYCEICKLHFSDLQLYKYHVNSSSHAKAVVEKQHSSSNNIEDDECCIARDGIYFCTICNTSVTGIVPWLQHKDGSQHLKKIKNKEFMSSLEKTKKIHERLLQSPKEISSTNDVGKKSVSINVSISDKSPDTSNNSDVNSLCKQLDRMKCTSDDGSSVNCSVNTSPPHSYYGEQAMFPFKCDPCCKKFTGIESYQQHMESAQHKKKAELNLCYAPKSYYCNVCAILLSGPIPYRQHMESVKHAKKAMVQNGASAQVLSNSSSSIFMQSTPKKMDEEKVWQQLLASKPINVSVEIKNNTSENSGVMKVIEADEPFTLDEESRDGSVERKDIKTRKVVDGCQNHSSCQYDKSDSDEDESKYDDAESTTMY